jgi:hypothetical protein
MRSEFGFERTECACTDCKAACRHLPGYLIPADLNRIAARLGYDDLAAFALNNLLASPGAIIVDRSVLRRIPTLTPARRSDGVCIFLDGAENCSIHADCGFGCAFFDMHQSQEEADRRSSRGLREIDRAWSTKQVYARVWLLLRAAGRVAPSPVVARARLQEDMAAKCHER